MLDMHEVIDSLPKAYPEELKSIQANPEDVATPEAITDALYDSYSAFAGERDWDRLRSLFYPGAGSDMVVYPKPEGGVNLGMLSSHKAYRDWCRVMINENNLFEWIIKREVRRWGHVAHVVLSAAVGDRPRGEGDALELGYALHNIMLYWDEQRWWIISILLDITTPENPLPPEFL